MIPDSTGFAALANQYSGGDRNTTLALLAVVRAADSNGAATFNDVTTRYREDYLAQLRAEGRDAAHEAGRLSLDEVRAYLSETVFPRLAAAGAVKLPPDGLRTPEQTISIDPALWPHIEAHRLEFAAVLRSTGDQPVIPAPPPEAQILTGSHLEAKGLTKVYRGRTVVNQVNVDLRQ